MTSIAKQSPPNDQRQQSSRDAHDPPPLHPAWRAFLDYCQSLRHGEIERLTIQDGLPVLAEVTKKKVKFA